MVSTTEIAGIFSSPRMVTHVSIKCWELEVVLITPWTCILLFMGMGVEMFVEAVFCSE